MLTRLKSGEDAIVYINEDHVVRMADMDAGWSVLQLVGGDKIKLRMTVEEIHTAFRDEDARRLTQIID